MGNWADNAVQKSLVKVPRILCLEDNDCDRELLEMTLTGEGIVCELIQVKTRSDFEAALVQNTFNLIISDFTLPAYDGLSALAAAQKIQSETPFIFVSGTIGEERALESLKGGATDYVLKDKRDRLVAAVRRALHDGQERAERKQLEEQLRQSQKMEAIGQLAGGVAHDFNNLLAVIQGNAELALMRGHKVDDQTREFLKQITSASERAAKLTRQLLVFGRKHTLRLESINLTDVIGNLTKMLNRIIGEEIRLQCIYEGVSFVRADAGMIEQVVLNLIINARDAMPQGGQLVVSATTVSVDELYAQLHSEARIGQFGCLKVTDTGIGIPPENLTRIFEPFFTTKEVGKGTGLGLATVYGIVKQHQGWVNVSSRVGSGTTFEIFLPAASPSANVTGGLPAEITLCGGNEKILLVEDDEGVRLMTRRTLESFGYQVVEAASGRKALELWPSHASKIDLLLTDIVMPDGINGRDLAERLRLQTPALKAIFVSGYSLNVISKDTEFFDRHNNYFLQKPYHSNALIQAIRSCLGTVEPSVP
jgi:two-component system, cell cycle sensor histidine kinase and response regulator CckA